MPVNSHSDKQSRRTTARTVGETSAYWNKQQITPGAGRPTDGGFRTKHQRRAPRVRSSPVGGHRPYLRHITANRAGSLLLRPAVRAVLGAHELPGPTGLGSAIGDDLSDDLPRANYLGDGLFGTSNRKVPLLIGVPADKPGPVIGPYEVRRG